MRLPRAHARALHFRVPPRDGRAGLTRVPALPGLLLQGLQHPAQERLPHRQPPRHDGLRRYAASHADIPQLTSLQDIEYVTDKLALDLSDAQAAEKLVTIIKETLLSEKSRIVDNAFHEANRDG